jgi:hypothetical protein
MTGAERRRQPRVAAARYLRRRFCARPRRADRLIEAGWLRRIDRDDKAAMTATAAACPARTLGAREEETEVHERTGALRG